MNWQCFSLTYELKSPLHIGYHKVGNVQRTRYSIPARNLWGAVTECLTRRRFDPDGKSAADYRKIGAWVQAHCAFTYFFVLGSGEEPLIPKYSKERGLCYGRMTQSDFERQYLGVHVTTALDAKTTTAETGSLHEVEFIAPRSIDGRNIACFWRFCFLDETAKEKLGKLELWRTWLGELQLGGERRYGFGSLTFIGDSLPHSTTYSGCEIYLNGARPCIHLKEDAPCPAHVTVMVRMRKGTSSPSWGEKQRKQAIVSEPR